MIRTETNSIPLYTFELFSGQVGLQHFITSRKGGMSEGSFASLNLGFHVGDKSFDVLQNRRIMSDITGIDIFRFTFANQCHSANIAIVDEGLKGRGAVDMKTALPYTDGMITNIPGICLSVLVADCVPIILYDPHKRVIAALHAGWKGALRKIIANAMEKMIQTYGCRAEHVLAGLGPSNGPCCYEVGPDVVRDTCRSLGATKNVIKESPNRGKYIFDQWQLNKQQLIDHGVKEANIEVAEICTQCHNDNFFSARAHEGHTGRFIAGVMLRS
jgi:polyphenol oxidase